MLLYKYDVNKNNVNKIRESKMEISNLSIHRNLDYQIYLDARETQKREIIARLQETALPKETARIRELQRKESIAYLNRVCAALTIVNQSKYPYDFNRIFLLSREDKKIEKFAKPALYGNNEARVIKEEYRELYLDIKKDRAMPHVFWRSLARTPIHL